MTITEILPGARVRATTTLIGTVERVEPHERAGREAPESLVVRADDDARHYRVPLHLVEAVHEEAVESVVYMVVQLTVAPADLGRYVISDDAPADGAAAGATLRIPLMAEELVAETQSMQRGSVRLHKSVETVEQRLSVPVTHEEVIVERIPADQYDTSTPANPDETIIPVVAERLVVETRAVIVEYIRLRTRRVTAQQEVRGPVRREVVTVEEQWPDDAVDRERPLLRDASDAGRVEEAARSPGKPV